MNTRLSITNRLALVLGCLLALPLAKADVQVGDAYARSRAEGQSWVIGTKSVQMTFEFQGGQLRLASYQNKLYDPPIEYVDRKLAAAPFLLASARFDERFKVERLWSKPFVGNVVVDPALDQLSIAVRAGEMIGFSVGPRGGYEGDQVRWMTTVDYGDGESYSSSQDAEVKQGPVWYYYVQAPGTGFLELMDAVEKAANVGENIRIPSGQSGYRAGGATPHIGPTVLHPSNEYNALRVWKAPKAGTVTLRGRAEHVGGGDVDLAVYKITEKTKEEKLAGATVSPWTLQSASAHTAMSGGRPAVQLDFTLSREALRAQLSLLAFPGTPVLRQWIEFQNSGTDPLELGIKAPSPAWSVLRGDEATAYVNYWMVGGNSQPIQGRMESAPVAATYHQGLNGTATWNFVPWMALHRRDGARDGLYLAIEWLGNWRLAVDHEPNGPLTFSASALDLKPQSLKAGERFALPVVTLGVFRDHFDNMAQGLYDWQYEYLWDYTHDDYYARMPFTVAWYGTSDNLQQQWAGHLGDLDFNWTEYFRTVGMELLWEDAGWSATRTWGEANMEGPDFARTQRFLPKNDMKLIVWIPGHQDPGLLDTKIGSWGNFQRRTDGMGFNAAIDPIFRQNTIRFLTDHPRSSFHTCSGGSSYSHTFDVQRYTDVNYDSDGPGSDFTNYYWSYLETPDKWFDNLNCWQGAKGVIYSPETGRRYLTQVPKWGLYISRPDIESVRLLADLYHYLLKEGVAGRWSYVSHPVIQGDPEHYYCQRLSWDRTRSIIIFKHLAKGPVTLFPRGLLPQHKYLLEFDSGRAPQTRTGADLMANGFLIEKQAPGELAYFNLPNRPLGGRDTALPTRPGRVLTRRETNLGHSGVGIYWSPGSDNNWISYYEVRRDLDLLGKASTGTYYFDHSAGWDPKANYAVRTVDGDGNASEWRPAEPLRDEPLTAEVLGALFAESGRDGWRAETLSANQTFTPMKWVPPARWPSADLGGTTVQPGGAEGYWESDAKARVGRGWQQAAPQAVCVRTWVAPQSGTVRIVGRAMKDFFHRDQGGPLRVRILHGDRPVWPETDWAVVPVNDLNGVSHDFRLEIAAGDTLHFALDKGSVPEHDLVAWMPRIVYVATRGQMPSPVVVRIRCGATQPYTDWNGNVWSEDHYFEGGVATATPAAIAPALNWLDDEALYQAGRAGTNFVYAIPLPPGLYCLRLKFAEPKYDYFFQRPFNLSINGREVLRNFDICHAARGPRRAYDRLFRYLVPDADGRLVLRFAGGWEPRQESREAMVQAIEILPEQKRVIRINAGSDQDFIDWNSYVWRADANFEGGEVIRSDAPVAHASPTLYDQRLYQSARSGKSFGYTFNVRPGLYTVHLKFAELWLKEPGQRPMNIEINRRLIWQSWDPAKAADKLGRAADIRAEDIVPDRDGKITIRLSATGANDAILQGLEIE